MKNKIEFLLQFIILYDQDAFFCFSWQKIQTFNLRISNCFDVLFVWLLIMIIPSIA